MVARKHIGLALLGALGFLCMAADAPATFKPDSDGFIRNWVVLEPIPLKDVAHDEATEKPLFAKEYFKGEFTATPKDGDKVKVDGPGELVWHAAKADDFQIDFVAFADAHKKDPDGQLFLGVAYIVTTEEIKDVKLAIGSDDSSVWWVNGDEVARAYDERAVTQDDNVSKPLTLKKGVNIVRFAVINGDGPSGACARFLDKSDKPVKNFTVMLTAGDEAATQAAK